MKERSGTYIMRTKKVNVGRVSGYNAYELAVKTGVFSGTYEEYLNKEQQVYNDMVKYANNAKAQIDAIIASLTDTSTSPDLTELIQARGTYTVLGDRLNVTDDQIDIILNRLNSIDPSVIDKETIIISGNDKNVELRNNGAYIQWKFIGYTGWNDLVALSDLTPNLSIGEVTTVEPDEVASASISGTQTHPKLNLSLPKGKDGIDGGSIVNIYKNEKNEYIAVIKNDTEYDSTAIVDGEKYLIPQIGIGTVETLGEDEEAYVTIGGTPTNIKLNFGIPRGKSTKITNGFVDKNGFLQFETK